MACSTQDLTALESSVGAQAAQLLCGKLQREPEPSVAPESVDTLFLLLCGAIIFSMHTGFAMLCAGSLRVKNVNSILVHTTLDIAVSAVVFYLFGFGLGFGENEHTNAFIGDRAFALKDIKSKFGSWPMVFIQWVFCTTATTIPHGAVAERVHFGTVLGYCIFIPLFVYPVLAHWVWTETGWLSPLASDPFLDSGLIDAGGCTTVHMVGGLSGLMGALLMGPRIGRFSATGVPLTLSGHSMPLVIFGALLLWFGWYCFNPVAILYIHTPTAALVVSRSAITTTLGGSGGLLMSMATAFYLTKKIEPGSLCNGLLVGCVATTAGSPVMEPWAALLSGVLSSIIFDLTCKFWEKRKIDDPLCASPMHGVCGAWGLIATGLFAKEEYVKEFYGRAANESTPHGLFYGGGVELMACQIIGIVVTVAWVCIMMGIFFAVMKYCNILRVTTQEEQEGLDLAAHDCPAYDQPKVEESEQIRVKTLIS